MKGINLRSLSGELSKVSPSLEEDLVKAIEDIPGKLAFCQERIDAYFEARSEIFVFSEHYHRLPFPVFQNFSFDEVCKLYYTSIFSMHKTVGGLFECIPNYEVIRKIKSSMWRWGAGGDVWNEVVDVYNGIRNFSLGLGPEFTVRLDYTTYWNERGNSRFSRTFLDGVFGFLVYFRGKHVMTIGFSAVAGRRILLQQVQLKEQTGNRWLYKFPKNRLEFVLDRFHEHFAGFTMCVIDGKQLMEGILKNYAGSQERVKNRLAMYRDSLATETNEGERSGLEERISEYEKELQFYVGRIAHVRADMPRIIKFYRACGKYRLGGRVIVGEVLHYRAKVSRKQFSVA